MKRRRLVIAVVLISTLAGFFLWGSSDEKQIKKVFETLTHQASFEGVAHPFEQLGWAREIASRFSDPFAVKAHTTDGEKNYRWEREELQKNLVIVRRAFDQLAAHAESLEIDISGPDATVTLTGKIMGREPGRSDYFLEQHPVKVRLEKQDGEWMITSGENLDVIVTSLEGE